MADKLTPEQRQELLRRYRNHVMTGDQGAFGDVATEPEAFKQFVESYHDEPHTSRGLLSPTVYGGKNWDMIHKEMGDLMSPKTHRLYRNMDSAQRAYDAMSWKDRRSVRPPDYDYYDHAVADYKTTIPGYRTDVYSGYEGAHHSEFDMGPPYLKTSTLKYHPNIPVRGETPWHLITAVEKALDGHRNVMEGNNPQAYANRPGYRGDDYLKKARLGLEHLRETFPEGHKLIADLDAAVTAAEQSYKPLQGPAEFPTEAIKRQTLYGED